ncbi:MAG: EFR1 family ferrodoxin [Chloroflexota bacterium]|nr:EFR1 family ferrodoxin [Chloroflexota bacterium]
MKGAICYYSGFGNTKLACRYIAGNIDVPFDLVDVVKEKEINLELYDVVGFATFTDFFGPPHLFQAFIEGLRQQKNKLAFVFNTYGAISGKTLRVLQRSVAAKGFEVIAGHSLHTPESYPPMIARGMGAEEAPDEKGMSEFDAFISELGQLLERAKAGEKIKRQRVRIGFWNSIWPTVSRTRARKDMGEKYVDESLCQECGICEKQCPYQAIHLGPKPVFDMSKCYGCWRCYNLCPERAIYTEKFRGEPYYPKPNDQLKRKLRV